MNRKNIKAVIQALKKETLVEKGIGFNMAMWFGKASENYPDRLDSCKSVACIAGTAYALKYAELPARKLRAQMRRHEYFIWDEAQDWLGLDFDQSDDLFVGNSIKIISGAATPQDAIKVLKNLLATGKANWSIASGSAAGA